MIGVSGGKTSTANSEQKGSRPLTSADHKNSSQGGEVKTGGGTASISVYLAGILPEPLRCVPIKKKICLHPTPDYVIPLITAKVKKNEAPSSSLGGKDESKLRCVSPIRPSRCQQLRSPTKPPLQSSDCQHGHLTNFSETHHKTTASRPAR